MAQTFVLIDDDSDDRLLFTEAAEATGKDIITLTTDSGLGIIEKMKRGVMELPDVIFLDVNMPGKDGWFCLNLLKQEQTLKTIPVIMYSTASNKIDIEKAAQKGALFLFTKPNLFEDLQHCLETIFMYLDNDKPGTIESPSSQWFHYPAELRSA